MKKASPEVKKGLIEAIKTQIKDNNPPETNQAYLRLLGQGILEDDVYFYLAHALACEMFDMMKERKPYDQERYIKRLAKLPDD